MFTFLWFMTLALAIAFARQQYKRRMELESQAEIVRTTTAKLQEAADRIKAEAIELEERAKKKAEELSAEGKALIQEGKEKLKQAEHVSLENKALHFAVEEITNLWINDTFVSISERLTAENYATQEKRLEKAFEKCQKLGIDFDGRQTEGFQRRLKTLWKQEIEAKRVKDEQERIKELMREEARAEKARAAELKKIEQEEREIAKKQKENEDRLKLLKELEALKQLTEEQKKELDSVVAENETLAKEFEERERRKAMAELTRAGHVYVISNVGSFGEGVFKVGMTRRLIPEDRIKELGDASVPFPFDVHMMISSEDAPTLESELHRKLWERRLNLVNDHKEFFRTDLESIKALVDERGGKVTYQFKKTAEASQWRESEERRRMGEVGTYDEGSEVSDEESAA